jgi:hypothetical protein
MPISSPANTIGAPGIANSSPAATSPRSASTTTVRIRAVSWEPSSDQEAAVDRHGAAARKALTVVRNASAGSRGMSTGSPP